MSKPWQACALHILDALETLARIRCRGNIVDDDMLYDAALWNLYTLSEATQRLPEDLKQRSANIPWQGISGFRNILVPNELGDIDADTVLAVMQDDLPRRVAAVRHHPGAGLAPAVCHDGAARRAARHGAGRLW